MISLDKILENASSVGIAGHVRPDADAFGSSMGLYLFIKRYYPSIKATVYLEDSWPESFNFICSSDEIVTDYPETDPADVFFCLDCSENERLGRAADYFSKASLSVVIDHHISAGPFGMISEIQSDASSTSELICLMIGRERLTKEIAEPLYMGIVHDTGSFHFSCTSSRTMMVTGWLMETGIDYPKIVDETYYRVSYNENQILGRALLESMLVLDKKVIISYLRQKDLIFYQVSSKDLGGIVQQLRVTAGVEAAIFLYETVSGEYKVSLRSNGRMNVQEIAAFFGGGGHRLAAGCTVSGQVHDVINNILLQMEKQLQMLNDEGPAGTD